MERTDVIVVGGGVSGLAFAWHAARSGRSVRVLEGGERPGGCLDTRRAPPGYWYELGAHTCYNSYEALLEIVDGTGVAGRILPRGDARKRFALLRDGKMAFMGPLSVFAQFDLWELLRSAPRALGARKEGASTYAYWSALVGKRNYARVLAPFLSAVPSQSVDAFPAAGAGSLFKKRTRRKDVEKSFTLDGGLGVIVDAMAATRGIEVRAGAAVREVRRAGTAWEAALADGGTAAAPVVALAVPPSMAAALLRSDAPELSAELARIHMAAVETVGVVVPRARVAHLPELAFVVPAEDLFWSAVTRDPVPDPERRAFAFHFRTGHTDTEKTRRICEVLGVQPGDFLDVGRRMTLLPSPVLGHDRTVAELDRMLAGQRLALTGNYFAGLAIEDCVLRSRAEWRRVSTIA